MSNGDDGTYNDSHRAFLQALLARGTLTYEEAKPILAAIQSAYERREILAEDISEADFNDYMTSASNAVSRFDLEIRSTNHQVSRQRIYALVNSTSDPITQLATAFSPDEIGFLKRVLDAMFETYNTPRFEVMAITGIQAMQLSRPKSSHRETQNGPETQGSASQALTMTQAEKTMAALVDQGWLEKSRKGFYSLSARAIMELRGWLMETYNDGGEGEDSEDADGDADASVKIKLCYACKEIVTVGQRCAKASCRCRLHDICTQNFFRMQKSSSCPVCKTQWTGKDFVGERAAPGTTSKRKSGAGAEVDAEEAVGDGNDDNDDN